MSKTFTITQTFSLSQSTIISELVNLNRIFFFIAERIPALYLITHTDQESRMALSDSSQLWGKNRYDQLKNYRSSQLLHKKLKKTSHSQ